MTRRTLALSAVAVSLACGTAATSYAVTRSVTVSADLKTTKRDGLLSTQQGTVDAGALGRGRMTLRSKIQRGKIDASFTVKIGNSTASGTAAGKVDVKDQIKYTGTAKITRGSGRFSKARASGLKFTGVAPLNGKSSKIQLRGRVSYSTGG